MPESDVKTSGRIKGYRVYPAIGVPVALAICAFAEAATQTHWALLALPFIYLGSICAAPNMNLADGFLSLIATLAGLVVTHFHTYAGVAILVGTGASWILSSVEKRIRATPITGE